MFINNDEHSIFLENKQIIMSQDLLVDSSYNNFNQRLFNKNKCKHLVYVALVDYVRIHVYFYPFFPSPIFYFFGKIFNKTEILALDFDIGSLKWRDQGYDVQTSNFDIFVVELRFVDTKNYS
jgi:hypothetical protein